ncbi:MAG: hypothetical protein QOG42_619 [Solirubrobacteraceae bacterium]|nr:hypothetical protein [Solirubrobacteraceae bacterium]
MSAGLSRCAATATALVAGAALCLAVGLARDAWACAGPPRCVAPPAKRVAPAGRIVFGALGSVARMLPAQAYGVDAAGRPVTAFAQPADGRLRLVAVRWTQDGAVDGGFGTGDSGAGVAQVFVDVATDATGPPRIAGTSDGGLLIAVPLRGIAASHRIALLRLDAAGRLASAFGAGGVAVLDGVQLTAGPQELAGGAIAVAGATVASAGRLAMLGAGGEPDVGFGQGGAITLPDRPTALAAAGDGLVVGLRTPAAQVRILRLDRSGRPDERSGPGGIQAAALPGADAAAPETLRAADGGTVTAVGTAQRAQPGAPNDAGPAPVRFAARFPIAGAGAAVPLPADGVAGADAAGRVLVAAPDGSRIRRYATDGRLDRTFAGSGSATTRLPRSVTRNPAVLAVLADGTIVTGGPGTWDDVPVPAFLRLRADGSAERGFGPRLLTPRQISARLRAHDVIALRVHCAGDAQRRCVVRLRAGARSVRAFVAPGGDRRIPVRVGAAQARRIRARGRAIVRVRYSVIDEAVRVEALDAPIVVRGR